MMNRPTPASSVRGALAAFGALAAALGGCGGSALSVESYRDPYFPEEYTLRFDRCVYVRDASRDVHILAEASSSETGDAAHVTQLLGIHVYWNPVPGRTPDHPSASTATLCLHVRTADGDVRYAGTGFVFPDRALLSDDLVATVEHARLLPAGRSGEAADALGEVLLNGKLRARNDGPLATHLRRELALRSGVTKAASAAPSP
jgi:hypothetical protein